MISILLRVLALVGLTQLITSCGQDDGDQPESIPPLPGPGPQPPDPPGTIYECVPPENSFLLILKGYGQTHPVRVWETLADGTTRVTDELSSSVPRIGCSVWSVDRLGAAEGMKTEAGIPYVTFAKWSNIPSPFPTFDDPDYLNAVNLLQGRALEHGLDNLFRGFPGTDLRQEGSWGTVLSLADSNLAVLGQNASLVLAVEMTINPETCAGNMGLWQAVRRPDGLEMAPETEGLLVLPFYREQACLLAEEVPSDDEAMPGVDQPIAICDDATATPCETLGMTDLTRLEVIVKALPIGLNPQDVTDQMMEDATVSGALVNFGDEGLVVLNIQARRPSFQIQLPAHTVNP